jgi:hypothetical protein
MSDFKKEIESKFALDPLSWLNPEDNGDMARLIIEAYGINAQATLAGYKICAEIATRLPSGSDVARDIHWVVPGILNEAARSNLATVGRLLGKRIITAETRDITAEPIRRQGLSSVPKISGVTNVDAARPDYNDRYVLAPQDDPGKLRLFESIPDPSDVDATVWWDIQILSRDSAPQPLVDLTVSTPTMHKPSLRDRVGKLFSM